MVQTKEEINDINKKYLNKVGVNGNFFFSIVRPRILEHYGNKCTKCGREHHRLHLHHEDYNNQTIHTIKPMCPSCHFRLHRGKNK